MVRVIMKDAPTAPVKLKPVSVKIPVPILKRIDIEARKAFRSRSAQIVKILSEALSR